ncbi:retrotransposon unclassified [Hordeum vulgare]|nr:retrotransposon unclassified [Hordeum vulgare]
MHSLGPVWCPLKGIAMKDLGENVFLFTFHQASGRKKAVEDRPWMFEKDLLVIEEYEASKAIDEYMFNSIPIWVRVFILPLGSMDGDTGEMIGNRIGKFLEVEGLVIGLVVGQYLRVKVRMFIERPLMRGTMLGAKGGKCSRWCPFVYEYLPEFSYVCGVIGHIDKDCSKKLKKEEEPQFGSWLRWNPPRRLSYSDSKKGGSGGTRRQGSWGSRSSGHGSDAPS